MPEDFMSDPSVPAHWRLLGILNGFFLNHKPVYASNDWLAQQLGCTTKTISTAVAKLEELELITCERTKRSRVIKRRDSNQLLSPSQPVTTSGSNQLLPNADINADRQTGSEAAYEIVKEEPTKPKKKTPDIPRQVYGVFGEVLGRSPLNWRTNKTQRTSAENLYTERGLNQIRKALETYQEIRDEPFCPQINTPYDLDSKWSKLVAFKKKHYGDWWFN